jgi:predicted patatin/cPLA2 family phospholipase
MILFILLSWCLLVHSFNQLSFSGGGSFGAVEIGILKRLLEFENKKYDLYTGISAGALNAGFISYFDSLNSGVKIAEYIYSNLQNKMIYDLLPPTGISVLNTEPLFKTLTKILNTMPGNPKIPTVIGATNLYSGNLDIFNFEDNDDLNKVLLLMSSSAIPGLFPPIEYNGQLYADGGTLSNELLRIGSNMQYLNITFITPYEGYIYDNQRINCLQDMLKRVLTILLTNYNNPLATMVQNCNKPIGEINKYYVNPEYLKGYNILNFDKGQELINIGYTNMRHIKYKIC